MLEAIRKRASSSSLWVKLLVSNILLLVVTVAVASLNYTDVYRLARDGVYEQNTLALNQTVDVLREKFSLISRLCFSVSNNNKVRELTLAGQRKLARHTELLTSARDEIYNATRNIDILKYYGVYLPRNEVLISDGVALVTGLRYVYGDAFSYDGMTEEAFRALLLGEYMHDALFKPAPALVDGADSDVMLWVQSLPYENPESIEGVVFCCLDMQALDALFEPIVQSNAGSVYIVSGSGETLYEFGSLGALDFDASAFQGDSGYTLLHADQRGDVLLTYVRATQADWFYVAAQPEALLTDRVNASQRVSLIVVIGVLLCGIAYSFLAARQNSMPLMRILRRIDQHMGLPTPVAAHGGNYDQVNNRLTLLMDTNERIAGALREQQPLARAAFLQRLVRGEFESEAQMRQFMRYAQVDLRGDFFAAVIVWPIPAPPAQNPGDDLMMASANRAAIWDKLTECAPDTCAFDLDNSHILALCGEYAPTAQDALTQLSQRMERLYYGLLNQLSIDTIISISAVRAGVFGLNAAYDEALTALCQKGDVVRAYRPDAKLQPSYRYTLETEARLVNLVKGGDEDSLCRALDALFAENNALPGEMQTLFLNDVRATLIKLADSLSEKEAETTLIKHRLIQLRPQNARGTRESIKQCATLLSRQCIQLKARSNKGQLEGVLRFLEDGYSDPALTVTQLADAFRVSEVYMSQFVREQTGETFTVHLERIRIAKACELICEGRLSVEQVALAVGYYSADTFRKAFKRTMGVTPLKYRKGQDEPSP